MKILSMECRIFTIIVTAALVTGMLPTRADAQVTLQAGSSGEIQPSQARCVTVNAYVKGPGPNPVAGPTQSCVAGANPGSRKATFYQSARNGPLGAGPHDSGATTVDLRTTTGFYTQVLVEPVPGQSSSYVPIQLRMPVSWSGILFNDSAIPPDPVVSRTPAHATVNMTLQLVNLDAGEVVAANTFHVASHGGIRGCLSIPKSATSAAKILLTCIIAVEESDAGEATVNLAAIVETGVNYEIQLRLFGHTYSFATEPPAGGIGGFGGHPRLDYRAGGLTWEGPMSFTVGSDAGTLITELQQQIDVLSSNQLQMATELAQQKELVLRFHTDGPGSWGGGGSIGPLAIAALFLMVGVFGLGRRRHPI